ncbi:MAG: type I methionyl aminopeptidase [Planctomycetaceae bacterium]|nr:type I methionyl aminopeptidase [Planctomycetaceae bacterium]
MNRGDSTIALTNGARAREGKRAVSPRPVVALRSVEEIVAIAKAGELAARALEAARSACVAGCTTADIDRAARAVIVDGGGEALFLGYRGAGRASVERNAYPAVTCISVNEELVHGVPGARVVCEGDVVAIDVGVRLDGWCADCATTVGVGTIDAESMRLLACGERMLDAAVGMVVPGRRWSDVARTVEAIASDAGFAVAVDFVGHGIGRELHEAPQVPCALNAAYLENGDFTLRPGMVLAIEPMIVSERPSRNERGELVGPRATLSSDGWTVRVDSGARSCHFEHTIAVGRLGATVLTPSNNTVAAAALRRAG